MQFLKKTEFKTTLIYRHKDQHFNNEDMPSEDISYKMKVLQEKHNQNFKAKDTLQLIDWLIDKYYAC